MKILLLLYKLYIVLYIIYMSNKNNKNDLSDNKILDLSNNLKFNDIYNKFNKLYISEPLDECSKKNINKDNFDLSNTYENNLNINKDTFSMTIKKLIENIEKNRFENINSKKSTIIDKLDERYKDISNSQIVCYDNNKKYNLRQNLFDIDNKYNLLINEQSIYYNKGGFIKNLNKKYHLPPPSPIIEIKKEKIIIKAEIDNINDLLKLINDYPLKIDVEYNIDMKSIHAIKEPLTELNNMVGMNHLKESIVDQILFFIQKLHINNSKEKNDFMHTCIYGPPGTGKTEIAKIIGKLYSKMGVLKKNIFKKATRADLIAGYLGQTAIKTKTMVDECIGGVLFIDEAYALGNTEKRDSFAKECIDTLCECLSNHKNELMVIIAGYKDELKNCFFNYNKGLDSRFTWRFKTDDYTSEELRLIFVKKVKDIDWKIKDIKISWFEDKKDYFKYYGRDMETLLAKVKIAHGRRVFCLKENEKKTINLKDMNKGFALFLENDEVKSRIDKDFTHHMYV